MRAMVKFVKKYFLMVGVTAGLIVLLMICAPTTRSMTTVLALLQQGIAPAVLGWGVLFNIKAGNWDFGVGAEVLVAAIIGGNLGYALGLGILGVMLCLSLIHISEPTRH